MRESVGGPNVCEGLSAESFSASDDPNNAALAFDDVMDNWYDDWYTGVALPQWIRVDFGEGADKAITEVLLRSRDSGAASWGGEQAPKDFAIQYSDNDVDYISLFSVTDSTGWGAGESRVFSAE
jgi:hypothetical protein